MKLYQLYVSTKEQIDAGSAEITLEDIVIERLHVQCTSDLIKATCGVHASRYENCNLQCRGIMSCSNLRGSEITYTSLLSRHIDRFLFPNQLDGACLHQGPTRKQNTSGNPEMADQYVVPFDDVHVPGCPLGVADSDFP